MKHYELLYIVSGKIAEDEQKNITNQVESLIKKLEGNLTLSESLGKKKLAYPIKKNDHGSYYVNEFDMEENKLKELEKNLKLINEIIRFLIIVKVPTKEKEEKIKEGKKVEKRVYKPESKPEIKKESDKKEEKTKKASLAKKTPKKEKKEKVSIEELDKKLDEILEDDITNQ
ncbi:MAG: 30S ribosomal protein S6 [Patescibacteria group bacterium]|nr:30S ribosomal protein S6 [Patescibacteria group bacterium]